MDFFQYLAIFFLSNLFPTFARISCVDDANRPVDWYVVYKLPENETERKHSTLGKGESYAYLKTDGYRRFEWMLSEKSVLDENSILGNTLKAFYENKKDLTYLLYNDEPATENRRLLRAEESETSFGHTKGVLVFDEHTGFWLIHSIPKFPPEEVYRYPKTGLMYGQIALCITFNTKQLNEIGKQLLFNQPDIYSKGHQEIVINSLDDDVKSLFGNKPHFVLTQPFCRISILRSYRRAMFVSFAKDDNFGKDLYSDLVAPYLKTSLFVETWRRREGTPLPPSCDARYDVEDVKSVHIPLFEISSGRNSAVTFSSFDDHSKWAVSSDPRSYWLCIGDINRMKSQRKRGGGTVCFHSPAAHQAFMSVIAETDHCPRSIRHK